MKLTLYTDYALRVLLYLSVHEEATISEIAEIYKISRPHVVKIVHNLGKLEYIETQRGRQGGIRLARKPELINLGEVVRAVEPNFHMVECFDGGGKGCVITPVCKLKGVLGQALNGFFSVLDGYSLADLTVNQAELLRELKR